MISTIKNGLREIDENVQYGVCKKGDSWDCLLIKKDRWAKSGTSNKDDTFYFTVSIVREDEIPEELPDTVKNKLESLGFRRTSKDANFEYTIDANEIVIEICTMEFSKPMKRKATQWIQN